MATRTISFFPRCTALLEVKRGVVELGVQHSELVDASRQVVVELVQCRKEFGLLRSINEDATSFEANLRV